MTPDSTKRTEWQLSLATILAFVFAIAIWLLLATRANVMERPQITGGVLFVAIVCAIFAYTRRRRAILLLIALFLFVVGGSHGYLRVAHLREMELRERRNATLHSISMAIEMYSMDFNEFPPPSTNAAMSGADLYRYLITPGNLKTGQPRPSYIVGPYSRIENGKPHFIGALDGRLLWARTSTGHYFLLDSGPDNLFGGTLDVNGVYTPGPVDANKDGTTDGEDDVMVMVGRNVGR